MTVRSVAEIVSTLDAAGAYDGLPFIREMIKYCGRTFIVRRRVVMLIQEGVGSSMRRIRDVVQLEGTLCDGRSHGECQRACFPLWKTVWLTRPHDRQIGASADDVSEKCLPASFPEVAGCQVTALLKATAPLPFWRPVRHFLALRSGTYSPAEYAAYISGGVIRRTLKLIGGGGALRQSDFPSASALSARSGSPPSLDLRPGDLVEVRSTAEIRATLDAEGKCRGLFFMPGMWAYCGRQFRVLQPVGRMMSERTGEMRNLSLVSVLEGATCDGKAHGGCQRGCYVFWKDDWLKKIAPP